MQYRANKKQSCKDKESQANFTEYPIFFRLLPLRRKCGRLLENLSRDKEPCNWYLTDDAWATFAKEKYELRPASKRKEATITAMVTGTGHGCMRNVTAGRDCARFYHQ